MRVLIFKSATATGSLQRKMRAVGMTEDQLHVDHSECSLQGETFSRCRAKMILNSKIIVLSAEDASLIAMEYGLNPVVDEERSFDIYPE